ncbi:CCA tRNA nucleotidyltransferase [Paenibacillus humicola]|uniref:CCA tRNA nucleotidyltransferase n=1 Tax=Paenibacillus humicola TaxID=3110540 RepID=UPI00237A1D3D|nr:CCA tRNA nucleotidyltransferase [Paenibacillus humicola]
MTMNESLARALPVLEALERSGFEAVFVGGCVRDAALGRPLKDVDIASSATPEQVMAIFARTVPTGIRHGTVTVLHAGRQYEVTTYRKESAYERYRRPAEVEFVTELEADLQRRDFTINAMAMRPDGTVVDPFGGMRDLGRRLLRCVGDADARFQEDALRMIRAVRFAAELGFRIAPATWRALMRHGELLRHVAMERVGAEADKMIAGASLARAAAWLAAGGLLAKTKERLPDRLTEAAEQFRLNRRDPEARSLTAAALSSIAAASRLAGPDDRWAAVTDALALKPEEALELFGRLRFAAGRADRLAACARVHAAMANMPEDAGGNSARCKLRELWLDTVLREGKEAAEQWLRVHFAAAETGPLQEADRQQLRLRDKLRAWLLAMPAASVKELAVRGSDLLERLNAPSGPWLGELLNRLLRAAAFGETANEREALLELAERLAAAKNDRKELP